MKPIATVVITACAGSLLALPAPVEALTTEQAEVGGMLAGVMCLRSKNLITEAEAKSAMRTAMENEGYSMQMVGDPEVKTHAMKMLRIISKDETCGVEL